MSLFSPIHYSNCNITWIKKKNYTIKSAVFENLRKGYFRPPLFIMVKGHNNMKSQIWSLYIRVPRSRHYFCGQRSWSHGDGNYIFLTKVFSKLRHQKLKLTQPKFFLIRCRFWSIVYAKWSYFKNYQNFN